MTKYKITREAFIGNQELITEDKEIPAAVYGSIVNEIPYAMGFIGKAARPVFNYRFKSLEQRDKWISEWLQGKRVSYAEKIATRAKRNSPHTLKVGDILDCTWGYEQTNVDFYEVVKVTARSVWLREIAQDSTETASMTGNCTPRKGAYISEARMYRANGYNCVRLSSYSCATLWDGLPVTWSSYH